MHNFRKLIIWKEAMELVTKVYELTKQFPEEERFNLTHQVRKSAVSIPSNIAEGAGRNSNREFSQFLGYATGSSYELETQLLLSERLGFVEETKLNALIKELDVLQKRIYSFKNKL